MFKFPDHHHHHQVQPGTVNITCRTANTPAFGRGWFTMCAQSPTANTPGVLVDSRKSLTCRASVENRTKEGGTEWDVRHHSERI